jgi:N-acetyl-alpha-D-muramate 1-phosphate uridylyltransferase
MMRKALPKTAMVMAAGLGKRMLPLTSDRPKPLVELAGRPLIDHCLERVKQAGVKRAVINVHYKADMMETYLATHNHGLDIAISDERALLMETGGGLMHAEHLIDADPFFCINSDNLWTDKGDNAFVRLANGWDDAAMDFLLLLIPTDKAHNHGGRGDFNLDDAGRITRHRAEQEWAPFVYTGIQMMSKRALVDAPQGPFSTMLFWERAIAAGRCFGLVHDGLWFDVGSPAAIPATEAVLADA